MKIMSFDEADAHLEKHRSYPGNPIETPIWREAGAEVDRRAKLVGVWYLGSVTLHVEALAVHLEVDGHNTHYPIADEPKLGNGSRIEFDAGVEWRETGVIWRALGMEGLPETIEIDGRDYVIIARPSCM